MYTVFTQVCWGQRKKKQNPLCINYNNPTSRERKKNPCWDQSRKTRCNHVSKDQKTTSLPTQVGKVRQTYSSLSLIIRNLKICLTYLSSRLLLFPLLASVYPRWQLWYRTMGLIHEEKNDYEVESACAFGNKEITLKKNPETWRFCI